MWKRFHIDELYFMIFDLSRNFFPLAAMAFVVTFGY